jgi:hypothetical protein
VTSGYVLEVYVFCEEKRIKMEFGEGIRNMKTRRKTIYKGELLNLYDIFPNTENFFNGVLLVW